MAGDGAWSGWQALGELAREHEPMVRVFARTLRRFLRLDGPGEQLLG